ncbi:hypothetical protein [Psychrobacillus sp. FSL H8-0510]|uniref:hypothetical protein n=1 Tax=Psychrobacillus sp. FSL H8-0510 TaxID=2921394 RepID=UPI0030F7217F
MLKTVKGKVIAGTVAVTLLAGTGAAFGSSLDAGQKLKAWYDGKFGQSTGEMVSDVEADVTGRINGLATEYEGLKTAATNSINQTKATESTAKSSSIDAEAQAHIDSINAKEAQISGYMATQFDILLGTANILINQAGTTATNYANTDLENHTGTKGTTARNELTEELTAATKTATDELSAEILAAKTALQTQLDNEKSATTAEIKAAIDAKINSLRTSITKKKDDLVVAQQVLITAKAVELEGLAIGELDTIVGNIDK